MTEMVQMPDMTNVVRLVESEKEDLGRAVVVSRSLPMERRRSYIVTAVETILAGRLAKVRAAARTEALHAAADDLVIPEGCDAQGYVEAWLRIRANGD